MDLPAATIAGGLVDSGQRRVVNNRVELLGPLKHAMLGSGVSHGLYVEGPEDRDGRQLAGRCDGFCGDKDGAKAIGRNLVHC